MRRTMLAAAAALIAGATMPALPAAYAQDEPTITTQVIKSFDDTDIYSTFFLPAGATPQTPVPVILRTHGWGGTGEKGVGSGTLSKLLAAGYAVLTWDQRGFGQSGGDAHIDAPEFEARDASVLIDWVAEQPGVLLDAPGDPVVGFTGGSYAGGIQLVTAAHDPRVDAIAPEIAWTDLRYSLFPNDVIKFGWDQLLYGAGLATAGSGGLSPLGPAGIETGAYARELHLTEANGLATDSIPDDLKEWYLGRSLRGYGVDHPVTVPTLIMQGSVDTLFNINEAAATYQHVLASGAPAKFVIFCGGHVSCPGTYADAGDRDHLDAAILTWFERYLRGDESVDTGPAFEYRTNEGVWRSADAFPVPDVETIDASGEGQVVSSAAPLGGGAAITATPSQDGDPGTLTFEVATAPAGGLEIVGIPTAAVDVSGTGPGANLFLRLIDREAGEVLNVQEAALRVDGLAAEPETFELDLVGLAYTVPEGHHLDMQIATSSLQFAPRRDAALVDLGVTVSVPVRRPSAQASPTPTASPTSTASATATPTATPSAAPTATGSPSPTVSATGTSPTLPTTGGGLVPLAAVAVGAAMSLRRRRR